MCLIYDNVYDKDISKDTKLHKIVETLDTNMKPDMLKRQAKSRQSVSFSRKRYSLGNARESSRRAAISTKSIGKTFEPFHHFK